MRPGITLVDPGMKALLMSAQLLIIFRDSGDLSRRTLACKSASQQAGTHVPVVLLAESRSLESKRASPGYETFPNTPMLPLTCTLSGGILCSYPNRFPKGPIAL
jgi:hypothetical protein